MKIIFNNLVEAKKFLDMVNLSKLCADEREWGCAGFIIRQDAAQKGSKEPSQKSYTRRSSDFLVITPHYKELSWLYRTLRDYFPVEKLSRRDFDMGFWAACTGFFAQHANKSFRAKTLLLFIINFFDNVDKDMRGDSEPGAEK